MRIPSQSTAPLHAPKHVIHGPFQAAGKNVPKSWFASIQIENNGSMHPRAQLQYPTMLLAAALCAAMLAACGSSALSDKGSNRCVRSPATFRPTIAPQSGATVTVKLGAIVYVELVEAEKYQSWTLGTKPPPPVFPWAPARSSNPSVLRQVSLCQSTEAFSLPVAFYAFRTVRPGTATLTAPIVTPWRRVEPTRRRGLHSYHATVIVANPHDNPQ